MAIELILILLHSEHSQMVAHSFDKSEQHQNCNLVLQTKALKVTTAGFCDADRLHNPCKPLLDVGS